MEKFPERHRLPRFTQEEANLNSPVSNNEIEFVFLKLFTKKTLTSEPSLFNSIKHFIKKYQFYTNSSKKINEIPKTKQKYYNKIIYQ